MGLEELAFRIFGRSFGTWFWVPNSQAVNPAKLLRWDEREGTHPFVLVADYDGGPAAAVRPRSLSSPSGIAHDGHPPGHALSCKIDKKGRIVPVLWSLGPDAICAANYSCTEPYEEILQKLRDGASE